MNQDTVPKSFSENPIKLVIVVCVYAVVAHLMSEIGVSYMLKSVPVSLKAVFETLFVMLVSAPILYLLLLRPMMKNLNELRRAEKALRDANEILESRVQQRTAELKKAHETLKSLTDHLQSVREDEKKYFAHRIHEELGQMLAAVKINLSLVTTEPSANGESGEGEKRLKTAMDIIDSTMQMVRTLAGELRPPLLDYPGLGAAVAREVKDFQGSSGIKCEIDLPSGEIRADTRLSTSLFRIVQEALANVLRHSKATRVKATLKERANSIELEVADNGIGIREEQVSRPGSFGLLWMRECVDALGGKLMIRRGIRNKGTTVHVTIPSKRRRLFGLPS
jgi:signal transduction histidine kinase